MPIIVSLVIYPKKTKNHNNTNKTSNSNKEPLITLLKPTSNPIEINKIESKKMIKDICRTSKDIKNENNKNKNFDLLSHNVYCILQFPYFFS